MSSARPSPHDARVASTLAHIETARATCDRTIDSLQKRQDTAEETLADIRKTLKKWDDMKDRFGQVLDATLRRAITAIKEEEHDGKDRGPPRDSTAHGFDCKQPLPNPKCLVECASVARPNMVAQIPAHEYHDEPEALQSKTRLLAHMLRAGKHSVVYTGAGISTAAGISDYATKSGRKSIVAPKSSKKSDGTPFQPGSSIDSSPTYAHKALNALHSKGLLGGGWVQQNHDALAQKSGFPQEEINEIHGSWFDPSNPVVPMDGSLRRDNCLRLNETKSNADLVLVMGTSLSGVAADQLVLDVGHRRKWEAEKEGNALSAIAEDEEETEASVPAALGVVIVNVQQTRLDHLASLRIFASCDEVMKLLSLELGLQVPHDPQKRDRRGGGLSPANDVWSSLPYNPCTGHARPSNAEEADTTLDLRAGQRVKLAFGNAPMAKEGTEGVVSGKTDQGHYKIAFDDGETRVLGTWMLEAARRGKLARLPVVNV